MYTDESIMYLIDSISGKTIELLFSTQTLYKPQMLNIKRIVLHNLSAKELPHAYTKVIGVVGRYKVGSTIMLNKQNKLGSY